VKQILTTPKILVAEDEPEVRGYLEVAFRSFGYSVELVEDGEETLVCLKENPDDYSLLLLDLMMPGKDGLETLRELRHFNTDLPVIVLSGASSPRQIVDAIKCGANDFLTKPVTHEDLNTAIQKALRAQPLTRVTSGATESISPLEEACFVASIWTKKLDLFLKHVGAADVPVLLQGETGVGKEVVARQIHSSSMRAKKPLLKLNCAALPSELIESELFGYERGAFTGAFQSKPGKFEIADGGTILLDEIGDMDFKLQAKLLQVLQDGDFTRLGGKEPRRVDVRVIAATHKDLEQDIADGRFREDLYYRLNVIRIEIPPLRERREEILPLAHFFIKKHTQSGRPVDINSGLKQTLLAHSWPGNIRELENVIRKLVVLRDSDMVAHELKLAAARRQRHAARNAPGDEGKDVITPLVESQSKGPSSSGFGHGVQAAEDGSVLSEEVRGLGRLLPKSSGEAAEPRNASVLRRVDEARKQAEIDAILGALRATLWNRKQAAALLRVDYKALLYKMKKLGIGEKASFRAAG